VGPTAAGRVKSVFVDVGDHVRAGQALAQMDPVDLRQRIAASASAEKRARAVELMALAQTREAQGRVAFTGAQVARYEELLKSNYVSLELAEAKRQERESALASHAAALANQEAAAQDLARLREERAGLIRQMANLLLVSPVDGLVTMREAEPGTTIVAGQAAVEVIDPASLWVNARLDQQTSAGLRQGAPAQITLRSHGALQFGGRVARVEPRADAVTEEIMAKIVFDNLPDPLPPIGELAEVTIALPPTPPGPVAPNASLRMVDGALGVWRIDGGALRFLPVKVGAVSLDGWAWILEGLRAGDRVVVYSQRPITASSRFIIAERLVGDGS
jgi:RND family efflux transporter MFP subunit